MILIVLLLSQSLNFQYLARKFHNLAIRKVRTVNEAKLWLEDFRKIIISYNQDVEKGITIKGVKYKDEAWEWEYKCKERALDIENMVVEYETRLLDPFSRNVVKTCYKRTLYLEKLSFKIGAVIIAKATYEDGVIVAPTIINKAFDPDVTHKVALTLEKEKILTDEDIEIIDFLVDIGAMVRNLKNTLTLLNKSKLITEASKFGLSITKYHINRNKYSFTVQRDSLIQTVVIEYGTTNPYGTLKWNFETGGEIESSPAIGPDGTIYIGSGNGTLYAINPNGTLKWKFTTEYGIESSPAIGPDGTIYIGSDDNNLYAINPDGTLKWKFTTKGEIISSHAIGSDGTIYIGLDDDNLYAINTYEILKYKFTTK